MAVTKISSYDTGYVTGALSLFPESYDSRYQLYEARNNCQTTLSQSLTYAASFVVVDNNDNFPNSGLIRVGPPAGQTGAAEIIYYDKKTSGVFKNLIRGFAGSRQNPWPMGSNVTGAVFAEHHNAVKDALINIETNLGTAVAPSATSLNGILLAQETRFLAPKALFRAFPKSGPPGTIVRFQNFSTGAIARYLWDFGDGTTSIERSPSHTYAKEGKYTVKLNIVSVKGAQGISEKNNYVTIDQTVIPPFFYTKPTYGISLQTATKMGNPNLATKFNLVDQTDGNIVQRYWVFDGAGKYNGQELVGESLTETNPNIHFTSYVYDKPGTYSPSLLVLYENQKLQRSFLKESITVE